MENLIIFKPGFVMFEKAFFKPGFVMFKKVFFFRDNSRNMLKLTQNLI